MRLAVFPALLLAAGLSSCSTAPKAPPEIPSTVEAYTKVVEDQLGPFWYHAVANDSRVTIGTVKLTFEIPAAGGRARNLKIVSNDAGMVDEKVARAAVGRLRALPIPGAILKPREDHISFEESFTILPLPKPSPSPTGLRGKVPGG